MTRKDYNALAASLMVIAIEIECTGTRHAWAAFAATVDAVADALAAENGRFDRERFMDAAGIYVGQF
jgi:hypothetical protein